MRGVLPTNNITQPFCVIVVHDKTTDLPVFGMSNYGLGTLDSDTVLIDNIRVQLQLTVDDLQFSEVRPTMGGGLHRRECTFNIRSGGPFSTDPFSTKLYSAGATVDNFYFGLWVTDFSKSLEDFNTNGMFLGYYDLDSGLGWDESSLTTTIRLVDRLTALTGRYNTNTENAEDILAGSEWQRLLEVPAYLGYRAKVQAVGRTAATIGGFEAYNKGVLGVIAGLVQSDQLSGTSIQLGKSPGLAAAVGVSVKLKMGNGLIIQGTITNLGGGEYGINTTGMTVGGAWDSVLVYNKGWTATGAALPASTTDLSSIFLDNTLPLTRIPSPTMWIKTAGTVELYNSGVVTTATPLFNKLTGIKDEANKELGCEQLKDPANPTWKYGGVSVEFDAVAPSSGFTGDSAHLNYGKSLAKQTVGLYFTNKTYVLADVQKIGMPWELIITPHVNNTLAASLTHVYYIRLAGNTTLAESATGSLAIYADDGKSLTAIPNTEITSVAYANTDFGMTDLCKITLNRRLTDINEAYDENYLYVDTSNVMYAGEVISFIMDQAGIHTTIRDFSLRDGTNRLGNPMSLVIKDETWSQLLDSVVFESGLQIDAFKGFYVATVAFNKTVVKTFNNVADATQTFCYADTVGVVDFGDVVDGTYKMDIGRMYTNIDATGKEFVRTHYTFQYPYSNYGGEKLRKLQSIKAAKSNDRIIDYTFKHINDTLTANAAALQMSRIGHVANIPETTRTIDVGLPFDYLNLQVLDSIRLVDFRHVTRENDPLPAYNEASAVNPTYTLGKFGPYARYTQTVPYLLIPGVGIVDAIKVNFSGSGVPITLTFKQVQIGTTSNLKTVAERIELATDTANTTPENTATGNYPYAQYYCRDPAHDNMLNITIEVPSSPLSGTSELDACCNSTSVDGNADSDPQVVIVCSAPCLDADGKKVGCADDNWPDGCIDKSNIYYEPLTDNEIGSTDPLVFQIYTYNDVACPVLTEIKYNGKADPDTCVSWAPVCSGTTVGYLTVNPCVFNKPEGDYTKYIGLKFIVGFCYSPLPEKFGGPRTKKYGMKTIHMVIPVTLRPVSDINLG